jgi:DegV family protein with EDD domain
MTVAILTDSGSDLTPALLKEHHIRQVPLTVAFGERSYQSPDELSPDEFWRKMRAPASPFARTAAPSAGIFKRAFEETFAAGADSVVYVALSETLSATIKSAQMAKEMMPGREIHVVDSRSACMGIGLLALRGAELARQGKSAADIAAQLTRLRESIVLYVALETLDYLRKGGRISAAEATFGSLLSIKPIITVEEGVVLTVDKPRTRAKAHERVIELLTDRPATEVHVLYSPPVDELAFRDELLARMPAPAPKLVTISVIGPIIGAHVGPGAYGAVLLRES